MTNDGLSLYDHLSGQLSRLCSLIDYAGADHADRLLHDLLGPAGGRALSQPPEWPSQVADDHTPAEFSLALAARRAPTLRILGEALAETPGPAPNLRAGLNLLDRWGRRDGLSLDRLDALGDLFLPSVPAGPFGLWYSLVLPPSAPAAVKVYLNPDVRGADNAPDLVAEGLSRLGLGTAYRGLRDCMHHADHFSFVALDLHDGPGSRVKVYVSHEAAGTDDVVRAAGAAAGIDADTAVEFCRLAAGDGPYPGRPLMSGYTFVAGDTDRPSGYSLYVPIRSYVRDDAEARDRVAALLDGYGLDVSLLDAAIGALTGRELAAGVGLIAHVSLRLGPAAPGVTVYLSSEAYAVAPARQASGTEAAMRSCA